MNLYEKWLKNKIAEINAADINWFTDEDFFKLFGCHWSGVKKRFEYETRKVVVKKIVYAYFNTNDLRCDYLLDNDGNAYIEEKHFEYRIIKES